MPGCWNVLGNTWGSCWNLSSISFLWIDPQATPRPSDTHPVFSIMYLESGTVGILTMMVIWRGFLRTEKVGFGGLYGFMVLYSWVSLASPWSGALRDLRKKFLNSLSSGMCGSTKAPPLYTDLQDLSLRSSRPRVPISQVGSRGSRVFLRCSATATTSAASRTIATTGRR